MKKVFYTLFALIMIFSACQTDNSEKKSGEIKNPGNGNPEFEFVKNKFNFGKMIQGEKVSHVFKFKNVGDGNLVISNISTTCGCTVPEYPLKPILPGEESEIKVTFNSSGKLGKQHKTITIYSNTEPYELVIEAEVSLE